MEELTNYVDIRSGTFQNSDAAGENSCLRYLSAQLQREGKGGFERPKHCFLINSLYASD